MHIFQLSMSEFSLLNSDTFQFKYAGCDVSVTISEGHPRWCDPYDKPQPEITEVVVSNQTDDTLLDIKIPDSVVWKNYEQQLREHQQDMAMSYC